MERMSNRARTNLKIARKRWGRELSISAQASLIDLTKRLSISITSGDLQLLQGKWYMTHSGLLRLAHRKGCYSLRTNIEKDLSDSTSGRWVFKAVVYKSSKSEAFTGYGDADPSNVSSLMHGAELRIAETRAVNRALRKAYGVGMCSVEELGSSLTAKSETNGVRMNPIAPASMIDNDQPRLRDSLRILIRQHALNPVLVKSYAAHFCGTDTLSSASRGSIESFISHLSSAAREDRDALVCKLNSYAQPVQVNR